MPASIITVANMKGGVGKTFTVLALARAFAAGEYGGFPLRVLVIDLDAQANASFLLCGDLALADLIEQGLTADAFLEDALISGQVRNLMDYVLDLRWGPPASVGPWIIPASPGLRKAEHELISFMARDRRSLLEVEQAIIDALGAHIALLKDQFDIILIDSSPGVTAFTQTALAAADLVIAPTVPSFIASLGLESFCKTVIDARVTARQAPLPYVVANRVRPTAHHGAVLAELRAEAGGEEPGFAMFAVEVPELEEDERPALGDPGAPAAAPPPTPAAFVGLAREVLEVIDGFVR
jgi:cellulose biosynthesis protein BcsQ